MRNIIYLFIIPGMLLLSFAHAKEVGEVKISRGAVTIQKEDGTGARLIGKGDKLQEGEVIKTGPKSFVIIGLADETQMTIRPKTSFAVEKMELDEISEPSALLRLFKGGFRAITGYISKRNPRGFKVGTAVATIGIRGTEFDARLCEEDCAEENKKLEKKLEEKKIKVIGRIVFKKGDVAAFNFADQKRDVKASSNLYEGDTIRTGDNSYAIIIFRDKSRISLQQNTDFRIDELRFEIKEPTSVSALFSLLKGGLRAITGVVGKLNPEGYKVRTRFSTIGIRGTGYDLLCTGPCAGEGPSNTDLPEGDGLYASVWSGAISLNDQQLSMGQSAYVGSASSQAKLLPVVPEVFKNNTVPKPNEVEADDIEFSKTESQDIQPGLYVSVTEGEVTIKTEQTNEIVSISKGQAAFADAAGQQVKQLPAIPAFQELDAYPTPDKAVSRAISIGSDIIGDEDGLVCEVN